MLKFASALAVIATVVSCGLVSEPYYKFRMSAAPEAVSPGGVATVSAHLDWRSDLNRPAIADRVTIGAGAGTLYTYDGPGQAQPTKAWLEANAVSAGQQVTVTAYEPVYWLAPATAGDFQLSGWSSQPTASSAPEAVVTVHVR